MIWKERNLFIRIHGQLNWIEWLLNEIVYGQKDQQFFSFAFFVIHFHWIRKRFLNNRTFFSFSFFLKTIMLRSGRNMLELIVCTLHWNIFSSKHEHCTSKTFQYTYIQHTMEENSRGIKSIFASHTYRCISTTSYMKHSLNERMFLTNKCAWDSFVFHMKRDR